MNIENRLESLIQLGFYIKARPAALENKVHYASLKNHWFTPEHSWSALEAIAEEMLNADKLRSWVEGYALNKIQSKNIGIIAAGNIPLVSFHDVLSVLVSGHCALIKLSEKDNVLMPHLMEELIRIQPEWERFISFQERWSKFDAVIATGSNNTGRYFEHYFGKYPHIIRKNRHSFAVISGNETDVDLLSLGHDVFDYFGLGCRNVSLLWIPKEFDIRPLLKVWAPFEELMMHNTYKNNLDYQRTLYLMNSIPLVDCDFVNMVDNFTPASPVSCLHLARYESIDEIKTWVAEHELSLQCMVNFPGYPNSVGFGEAQRPSLFDYADGIDTMNFLISL
jgi:hypothetical protein